MKKFLLIIIILLLFSVMVSAKLSDETLKTVEDLRWKDYWYGNSLTPIDCNIDIFIDDSFIYEFQNWSFKDGKLFVETHDGKWFIEMKKIEEEK